ncbi:MAG TPA: hypothetical protein DCR40_10285 [Prolixibacteraceae bacterium]|nr:hypothetical protein [Prolixibacteraceae bacterium]
MKSFSELGVTTNRRFVGDKIKIEKIEGAEIIVLDYEVRASKLSKENDPNWKGERKECLYLQIEVGGQKRVLWGSYMYLIDQISQVKPEDLPFKATIVNEHGYVFK